MFVCGVIGCCLIMRIAEPWEGNVVRANPQVIAKLQKIMVMSAYVCKKIFALTFKSAKIWGKTDSGRWSNLYLMDSWQCLWI